jgi:hypothetical protein
VDPAVGVSLLVDAARWPAHGRLWAHLVSDVSLAELHAFAARLGLPRRSFEGDHYDVPAERVPVLLAAGAEPVSTRELLVRLRAAGLRTPKRRGEKVLRSTSPAGTSPAGTAPAGTAGGEAAGVVRVDLVSATAVPAPHAGHVVVRADGREVARVADPGARRVLGFRRTWTRTPAGTRVEHEGVLLAGPDEAAPDEAAPDEAGPHEAAPEPTAPAQPWWAPLLGADSGAGAGPPATGC